MNFKPSMPVKAYISDIQATLGEHFVSYMTSLDLCSLILFSNLSYSYKLPHMTSAFTYKGDSRAQLFENILANWIGHKGQWLIYYFLAIRGLDCNETWLSRVSWPKILTKTKIPLVL